MNGPEHYQEAERALVEAARLLADNDLERAELAIAAANAHAQLAQVAATLNPSSTRQASSWDPAFRSRPWPWRANGQ